jgi:hypothetical protein
MSREPSVVFWVLNLSNRPGIWCGDQTRAGPAGAFGDLDTVVRQSIARIKASPFVPDRDAVRLSGRF